MKKNNSLFISIVFLLLSVSFLNAQVDWPFEDGGVQATQIGTMGEYRYTNQTNTPRFHLGADLHNGGDRSIYAINSGTVTFNNGSNVWSQGGSYILVNGVFYYHCKPTASILNGSVTNVEIGDYIGEMLGTSNVHVHLQESNTNYLDNNLSPYTDDYHPEVITTRFANGYKFYRNGIRRTTTNYANLELNDNETFNNENYTVLYSKIDIVADIEDRRVGPNGENVGGRTSPYSYEYSLHADQSIIDPLYEYNLTFDVVPNNDAANFVFHPQSVAPGAISTHILTSYPRGTNEDNHYDRFFNTLIREGATEDWDNDNNLNAHYNGDAEFPDNLYNLVIDAFDVDYNNNPHNRLVNKIEAPVLIDNFKPFIKSVSINNAINNANYYDAEWKYLNEELSLDVSTNNSISLNLSLKVKVTPSEPLKELILTFIESSYFMQKVNIPNGEDFWEVTIPPSNVSISGTQNLIFLGTDLADNNVLVNPSILGHRQADGTWPNTLVTGNDQNHQITISGNSGTGTFSADFNHYINNNNQNINNNQHVSFNKNGVNCLEISFQDTSAPVDNIIGWAWQFGDVSSSTATVQNPVFAYPTAGVYDVSLTVTNNSNQTSTITKTITVSDCNSDINAQITADVVSGSSPLVVDFTDLSTGDIYERTWNITGTSNFFANYIFGDEHSQNPTISFNYPSADGTWQVSLTLIDGNGNQTISNTITINTTPTNTNNLNVNFSTDGAIYTGSHIIFKSEISGGCNNFQYQWTFNDWNGPHYSSLPETIYSFPVPGVHPVELCVTDNCGDQACFTRNITIQNFTSNTIADFSSSISNQNWIVQKGQPITFYDRSEPSNDILYWSWYWDYDVTDSEPDLNYFNNEKPSSITHTYNEVGMYKVRLYVAEDIYHAGSYTEKLITVVDEYDYLEIATIHEESNHDFTNIKRLLSLQKKDFDGFMLTLIREVDGTEKINLYDNSNILIKSITPPSNKKFIAVKGYKDIFIVLVKGLVNHSKSYYIYRKSGQSWNTSPELFQIIELGNHNDLIVETIDFIIKNNVFAYSQHKKDRQNPNSQFPIKEKSSIVLYEFNQVSGQYEKNATLKNSSPKFYSSNGSPNLTTGDFFGHNIKYDNNVLITHAAKSWIYRKGEVLIYKKPESGWHDNIETARLSLSNCSNNDLQCGLSSKIAISHKTIVAYDGSSISNIRVFERPLEGWKNISETAVLKEYSGNIEDDSGVFGGTHYLEIGGNGNYVIATRSEGIRDFGLPTSGLLFPSNPFIVFYKSSNGWVNKEIEDFRVYPLIPNDGFRHYFNHLTATDLSENTLYSVDEISNQSESGTILNKVYTFNLNESFSPEQAVCYSDVIINNVQYTSYQQTGAEGQNITISNVTVNQNIGVSFKATNQIVIKPNTITEYGSNFEAKIVDCNLISQ